MDRTTENAAYATNATFDEVARRLLAAKSIAITSHMKLDGDALGSMLALGRALRDAGGVARRRVDLFVMGPLEPNLASLAGEMPLHRVEDSLPLEELPEASTGPEHEFDVIVVVDTGAWSQLEPLEAWLRPRRERIIVIDHHARGDDVAATRIVETRYAATAQLLLPLLDAMGCDITGGEGGVAEALFLGLATDTGWFRYPNADADVFAAAARLLRAGVDKARLFRIIEETHRPERLALEARALASLEYLARGEVAVMSLGLDDFRETGGLQEDMTGIVNLPLAVAGVRVSVLLSQSEPARTKLSFRSKPALGPGSHFVDVNEMAQRFGGGGHVHAAGARMDGDLEAAREAVRRVFADGAGDDRLMPGPVSSR